MSHDPGGSVTRFANDLRSPDAEIREQAARRIWERFERRLLELVRRRLNPKIRVREDEHDIVQSMFKSFFAVEKNGTGPVIASREELWKFLVWMAMCRVANTAHKHQARRRDVRREQPMVVPGFADENVVSWLSELRDRSLLTPEQAAITRNEFDRLLNQLREDYQQIFVWRLEGYTNSEIGRMMKRTERTVELKMKIIREVLRQGLEPRPSLPSGPAS